MFFVRLIESALVYVFISLLQQREQNLFCAVFVFSMVIVFFLFSIFKEEKDVAQEIRTP